MKNIFQILVVSFITLSYITYILLRVSKRNIRNWHSKEVYSCIIIYHDDVVLKEKMYSVNVTTSFDKMYNFIAETCIHLKNDIHIAKPVIN